MSVIAQLTLESPILRETLRARPEVRLVRVQQSTFGDDPGRLMFWAESDDLDAFEAAAEDDSSVSAVVRLTQSGDRALYRIDIADRCAEQLTYPTLVELDIAVLHAEGAAGSWNVRFHAPNRRSLQRYVETCRESEVSVSVNYLYTKRDVEDGETHLTDSQREVLALALEEGYFDIPRETTTHELGDNLGVSGQAISERLRRALRTSVVQTLEDERLSSSPE
jgi:hypothetical protein